MFGLGSILTAVGLALGAVDVVTDYFDAQDAKKDAQKAAKLQQEQIEWNKEQTRLSAAREKATLDRKRRAASAIASASAGGMFTGGLINQTQASYASAFESEIAYVNKQLSGQLSQLNIASREVDNDLRTSKRKADAYSFGSFMNFAGTATSKPAIDFYKGL